MRHTPTLRFPAVQFPAHALSVPAVPPMALAAFVVGALDLLSCSAYWAFHGVPMARVMRGPAAWIVGAETAQAGGAWTMALGGLVLYLLAALEIAGYRWLATRAPRLLRQPLRWGMAYGALAFAVLDWVLLPLSAAPPHRADPAWTAFLLGIYVFLIGVPCALFARWMAVRR